MNLHLAADSLVTGLAVVFSIAAWVSAARARRAQATHDTRQVEAEAYGRAQAIYTQAIAEQERELARLRLRNRWLELRAVALEATLHAHGIEPPEPLPALPPGGYGTDQEEAR